MSNGARNKVFVYRNLNRKGVVWSVKDCKSGLVIDRDILVLMKDVELKVSQAGRQRVLKQQKRNVHAGIKGDRVVVVPPVKWIKVTYNPYKDTSFVHEGRPILTARYAKLWKKGLYVAE